MYLVLRYYFFNGFDGIFYFEYFLIKGPTHKGIFLVNILETLVKQFFKLRQHVKLNEEFIAHFLKKAKKRHP